MKKKSRLRVVLAFFIIMIQPMLIGAGFFSIGLRNVDTKEERLVKIDELIGGKHMPDASKVPNPGDEDSENDTYSTNTKTNKNDNSSTDNKTTDNDPSADNISSDGTSSDKSSSESAINNDITLRIREKGINHKGNAVLWEEFDEYFSKIYSGQNVIVVDDYADYRTYMNIREYLNDKNIKFKEKTLDQAI